MKRITRQIRIEISWHRRLKIAAAQRGVTIANLIEEICEACFGKPSRITTKNREQTNDTQFAEIMEIPASVSGLIKK